MKKTKLKDYEFWVNYQKAFDNILLDEANVKQLDRRLFATEKGEMHLIYDRDHGKYWLELDSKKIEAPKLQEYLFVNQKL